MVKINHDEFQSYNAWREAQGLTPLPAHKPVSDRRSHLFHLSEEAWEGLQTIAGSYGFSTGKSPNVTLLLEAIGQGIIETRVTNKS